MRTKEEIQEWIRGKQVSSCTSLCISEYNRAKDIDGRIVIFSVHEEKHINCTFKDYIDWFEGKDEEEHLLKVKEVYDTFNKFQEQLDLLKINKLKTMIESIPRFECPVSVKKKEMLVPDEIVIVKEDFSDVLGIIFNLNQILSFSQGDKCYVVLPRLQTRFNRVKCELVKTIWEDLKAGDICFIDVIHEDTRSIANIGQYYIKINEVEMAAALTNGSVHIYENRIKPKNYYKVVPIK